MTDSAGIHSSNDLVEKEGIEMAKESIPNASVIIFVLDVKNLKIVNDAY